MLRSTASGVVSMSTGRRTPGGKEVAVRPWTSRGSVLGAHSLYRRPVWGPLGSGPDKEVLRAAVDGSRGGAGGAARVATHRGRTAVHVAELVQREGAARGQAGVDLTL